MRVLLFVLVLFSFSCQNDTSRDADSLNESVVSENSPQEIELHAKDSAIFSVDDEISSLQIQVQYAESPSPKLIVSGRDGNSLYFFDWSTRKLTNKITFPKEGLNSIPSISSFYYISEDSILLIHDNSGLIALSDGKGEISKKVYISKLVGGEELQILTKMQGWRPIWYEEKLFLTAFQGPSFDPILPSKNLKRTIKIDIFKQSIELIGISPFLHSQMGVGFQFFQGFTCLNKKNGDVVTSYPLSDSCYFYNLSKNETMIYKMNNPQNEIKFKGIVDQEDYLSKQQEYYLNTHSMGEVVFNASTNEYYRAFYSSVNPDDAIKIGAHPIKEMKLLCYNASDMNFKAMYKVSLFNNLSLGATYFVGPDGFYIQDVDFTNGSEDEIVFKKIL